MTEKTPAEKLIEVAKAEDAKRVREVGGMNRGPDVETYQKTVGLSPGSPWCAAFVAYGVKEAKGFGHDFRADAVSGEDGDAVAA